MRIDLNVNFQCKDHAKRHGARWDALRKTWYLETNATAPDQLVELARYMPRKSFGKLAKAIDTPGKPSRQEKPAKRTERLGHSLCDCRCNHVAPWLECEHTGAMELDDLDAEHMRAIASGF